MMQPRPFGRRGVVAIVVFVAWLMSFGAAAVAADPAFVGVLALAVDEEGARRLDLSEETLTKLIDLIDERESAALDLVLDLKDLPPAEQAKRLAPFVEESERRGMELLTLEQRSRLQQLRVARTGMSTLAEPDLAEALNLTDEQKAQIQQLLEQRAADMAQGAERERQLTHAVYERRLAAVLSESQLAAWKGQAGLAANSGAVAAAPAETPQTPADAPDAPPAKNEVVAADEVRRAAEDGGDRLLYFNFDQANWRDVLMWLGEEADLALQLDLATPPGTFSYRDAHGYTVDEAIDLVNSFLIPRAFTLVQRERALMVLNLEDPIPQEYFELVPVADLKKRGDYELIKCLFPLARMTAEEAEAEFSPMLEREPFRLIPMPKSRQILVTGTGALLKTIRDAIEVVENPGERKLNAITHIKLDHVTVEDVIAVVRPLLDLPEDSTTTDLIKISTDPLSSRIFATGEQDMIDKLNEVVELLDVAPQGPGVASEPPPLSLAAYPVLGADLAQVMAVLQTQLAGDPEIRLGMDPVANKVVLLGRPEDHQIVIDSLRIIQGESEQIEVIQLQQYDPQEMVLSINQLFGLDREEAAATGPKVGGNVATGQLWVRGTPAQIDQVKQFVARLEGPPPGQEGGRPRTNLRVLPLNVSGQRLDSLLRNVELFWPESQNRIEIIRVNPSAASPLIRERRPEPSAESDGGDAEDGQADPRRSPRRPPSRPAAGDDTTQRLERPTSRAVAARTWFVSQIDEPQEETAPDNSEAISEESSSPEQVDNTTLDSDPGDDGAGPSQTDDEVQPGPVEIRVAVTPAGLVISSNDLDALDRFETLVRLLAEDTAGGSSLPVVFPLKYAPAEAAAVVLNEIFTGGAGAGGDSMIGGLASEAVGGIAGSFLGQVIGGGGSTVIAGAPSIIAEPRLNVLIVQGAPADVELISSLVEVIDRESIGDVETRGRPKRIRLYNTLAEDAAEVIKQAFPDRILSSQGGGGGGGRQQQPSPGELIAALTGGRGGPGGGRGRGGANAQNEDAYKMTIAVDERTNSLYITAPEPLFRQVEELVVELDQAIFDSQDTFKVVTLRGGANATVVQGALSAMFGDAVRSAGEETTNAGQSSPSNGSGGSDNEADMRREIFRALQQRGAAQPGGGGPAGFQRGGFGGGDRGGFGGGRGSFGGDRGRGGSRGGR